MSIKNALVTMLKQLDKIADEHGEVYDTAVREEMAIAVHHGFIKPKADYEVPNDFAMFSDEGNQQVRVVIAAFLNHAEVKAAIGEIISAQERLDAFQDDSLETESGTTFEDYFAYIEEPLED